MVNFARGGKIPGGAELCQLRDESRRYVRGYRNHSISTVGHHLERHWIVAGQNGKRGRSMPNYLADLGEVARRFLYRDDVLVLGELQCRCRLDIARGPPRHIVNDDRYVNRIGDGAEMRND